MKVENLSFSAHADSKGILQLIRQVEPRSIFLVHGEKSKMAYLKAKIKNELLIPTYDPPNGTTVTIESCTKYMKVEASNEFLKDISGQMNQKE